MHNHLFEVRCDLPNADAVINGISFDGKPGNRVAVDVPQDQAQRFADVPGYSVRPMNAEGVRLTDAETPTTEDAEGLKPLDVDDLRDSDSDQQTVADAEQTKPVAEMNVAEIEALLKARPEVYGEVETMELSRDSVRRGVSEAIERARAKIEGQSTA